AVSTHAWCRAMARGESALRASATGGKTLADSSQLRQYSHLWPAASVVARVYAAARALDRALCDCQPEPAAAALALARHVGAEVGLEDPGTITRWDAGSAISEPDAGLAFDSIEADADGRFGSRVLDRIAHDVLDRAGD